MLPVDRQSKVDHWLMYVTPIMNVNYLSRFNVSPVDEYSSTHEKVQLSTRVQFSVLVSTLLYACLY